LAGIEIEADAVDGLHDSAVGLEFRVQVLHLQDRRRHYRFWRGSRASRNPSPRKLKAIRVSERAIEGKITMCGAIRIAARPSEAIDPHDGVGGWTPIPRKERKASKRMAA